VVDTVGPLVLVAGHTLAIYLFLIVCLRYFGRRQTSQLTLLELVVLLILGSAVETSMVAGHTDLLAGLVSATTLLVSNRLLTRGLARSGWLQRLIIGGPILLVNDGQFLPKHLAMAGLTEADVLQAIRERGFADLERIRFAVLEVDGSVGVVPKDLAIKQGGQIRRTNRKAKAPGQA
jgi:uncharacterized membrane protein YcaP (DUF421 family)